MTNVNRITNYVAILDDLISVAIHRGEQYEAATNCNIKGNREEALRDHLDRAYKDTQRVARNKQTLIAMLLTTIGNMNEDEL